MSLSMWAGGGGGGGGGGVVVWWGLPRGTKTVPFHHVAVLLLLHGFFCFVLCALTSFASYTLLSMRHRSYTLLPFYPLERVEWGEGGKPQ